MNKTSVWTVSVVAMGAMGIAGTPACVKDELVGDMNGDAGAPPSEGGHEVDSGATDSGARNPKETGAPGDTGAPDGGSAACASKEGTVLATSPTETRAAFPEPTFIGLVLDSTSVYWLAMPWNSTTSLQGQGALLKVSKSGGAPVKLAADKSPSWNLAAAAGQVYWESDGFLYGEATGGGSPESLSYGTIANAALVADETNLYSFGYWPGAGISVLAEPLGGGAITNVMEPGSLTPADILTLAVGPDNVYWVGWLGSGAPYGIPPVSQQGLWYVPKAGGTATLLSSFEIQDPSTTGGLNVQPHVAADATGVYWNSADGVMRMPSVSSAAMTLVPGSGASFGDSIEGLAVDGVSLYWLDGAGINSVPIGGGAATRLVHEPAIGLAVDETSVYWINGCGQIKKTAK